MEKVKTYKDLIVWNKSIELVRLLYEITKAFPKEELYGLTSQMRRSAVSIPSNIAEGAGRSTRKDYGQFLYIAYGSAFELETQLIIAKELGYLGAAEFEELSTLLCEISKMLRSLIQKLKPRN